MQRLALAALAAAIALVCLPAAAEAPLVGTQILDAATDDPAVGICRPGARTGGALLVATVDDGGSHAVTISTRACPDCPWIEETSAAGAVTPSAPYQIRIVGWVEAVRISVANAGGDAVDAWCSTY